MTTETPKKPMKFGMKILVNLLAMVVLGILLLWFAAVWLDVWTDHGKYLEVPDVRRVSYDEAVQRLENEGFIVELSDSVYDNSAARYGGGAESESKHQGQAWTHGVSHCQCFCAS